MVCKGTMAWWVSLSAVNAPFTLDPSPQLLSEHLG